MTHDFITFFRAATGNTPCDYQRRLAGASEMEGAAPSAPFPCTFRLAFFAADIRASMKATSDSP